MDISVTADSHSVTLTLNSNPEGATYLVRYTACPVTEDSSWTGLAMTDKVLVVGGLEADRKYAFRFAPILHGEDPVFGEAMISKYVE